MGFSSFSKLAKVGVLGMNRRNAEYIMQYNPRERYPLVDDKLLTKQMAIRANIAVPQLYGVIEIQHQISSMKDLLEPHQDFVIKPAHGSGGDGILVITDKQGGHYRRANGAITNQSEINYHVSNILSGMYSLSGIPDKAVIEYRVKFDPLFEKISYQGVPDIRMLVFQGYPVMAMVRLPSRMSDGKANLHQGAVGVGIDLATGKTKGGVWFNDVVDLHPDTGNPIAELAIPYWESILELSSRCFELSGLGYLGVDIVLDKELGPLILELNARPGLNIQIANNAGLLPRLEKVKAVINQHTNVAERVQFSQEQLSQL